MFGDSDDDDGSDEIMEYIMATKHYMRPVSLRYWMKARELNPSEPPKCTICFEDFEEENFLEYWVSRKVRGLHNEETEIVSAKRIAIQLSNCAGEHFFHSECIAQWLAPQRQCPLCKVRYGVEIGNQPEGVMTVRIVKDSDVASKGTENRGKGTIEIVHKFPAGIQKSGHQNPGQRYAQRTEFIYLPNTKEGKEILGLIHVGWRRKVLYTVGRSVTRNLDNQIIWNGVHFKTSRYGGLENYGWPDLTYYARAKDEFKQKGITVEDIPKRYQRKK